MAFKRFFGRRGKDGGKKPLLEPKSGKEKNQEKPEPSLENTGAYAGMRQGSSGIMAKRLAVEPKFVQFCKAKRLGNPEEAFARFYNAVERERRVWKMEAGEEERFEDAGKHFSRTGFYAKLFIKCGGDPANLYHMFFKQ